MTTNSIRFLPRQFTVESVADTAAEMFEFFERLEHSSQAETSDAPTEPLNSDFDEPAKGLTRKLRELGGRRRTGDRPAQHVEFVPRVLTAAMAAAYCDEASTSSFCRSVGTLYPQPIIVAGKGKRWLKEELDAAIDKLAGRMPAKFDAADDL